MGEDGGGQESPHRRPNILSNKNTSPGGDAARPRPCPNTALLFPTHLVCNNTGKFTGNKVWIMTTERIVCYSVTMFALVIKNVMCFLFSVNLVLPHQKRDDMFR